MYRSIIDKKKLFYLYKKDSFLNGNYVKTLILKFFESYILFFNEKRHVIRSIDQLNYILIRNHHIILIIEDPISHNT